MKEIKYPTGLTTWGPIPETTIMHILWPGPGAGLFLVIGQPTDANTPMTRIEHHTASALYATREQARQAVNTFIRPPF